MATTTNSDTPLLKAAELIEGKQQVDGKFPVISELLHASSSGEYEVAIPAEWQVVTKQRLIPLPDALFEQYDLLECRCFMGLFPEIRRAWITVDHRLFLWNYEDESDFYSFEDQEQIIVSVALVKPRPGVFVDSIKHVLVVATPLEVFLLGVGYNVGRLGGARGDGGEVTLYATQISVPADGVAMTSVVGTVNGRVFMSGNDGALYEFVYQSEDGWLTKKARKVCLTSTITSYFIPTFLAHKRDTPAISMVADDERKLLYVLLQDASIKVYWLGTQGTEFILAHHHRSISNSAALLCPQFNEGTDAAPFEIASMHVIPFKESRTLAFVAITSGGCRLYFSTVKRMQRFYETSALPTLSVREPDVFEVVHVRLPPDSQPTLGGGLLQSRAMRQMLNVHTAFYRNGTTMMAHTWNEDHDSIIGAAPACAQILARIARQPRASLAELFSVERIEGRTWAIAEIGTGEDSHELNDLVTVSSTPTRTFAVLTNAGVTILEKQRPVDMIRALIAQPTLRDAQLKEFIATYGLDETCAMCYTILCTEEFSQQMVSIQVLNAARRILFEYGGVPHFAETSAFGAGAGGTAAQAGNATRGSADGGVSTSEQILLSGRHNGLVIYLSRALKPVWRKQTITSQADNVNAPRLHVGIATADLVDIQERLRRLQHFINNNQRFVPDQLNQMPMQPANSMRSTADASSCWQAEAASLGALYDLIIYSIEAISFLCLLADFNLPSISSNLPVGQLKTLSGIEFNQLVCGERGRLACKELILVLINSQLKQNMSIDSLSDVLSKRCSSMFSTADVALYKALESLKLAGECEEGTEANDLAAEALSLLTGIAGTLSAVQLREICSSFETLGQFGAVATLSLACAAQSDPNDEAMSFWGDGAPENDSRELIYRKRLECYKCIIDMLDKRKDTALNAKNLSSLPNTDGLFQFALYDWLLENDKSTLLFHMHGPFVEQYLIVEPRTVEKADMLWHYYIHCDQFGKASFVQRELACSRDYEIDLSRRIEYLSLSISNAKIAVDMVRGGQARMAHELSEEEEINQLGTLLRENEDQLEIAQVQLEIQQQLRSMGDHETPARALDRRLFTVTELYDKFAEPLRLWDAILLIFKASNHDDPQMVEEIWRIILRTVLDDSQRTGLMAVASKVANLGNRLYPSAAAFPLPLIAGILVDLSEERASEYIAGFVGDTLVQARVPHWAVFEVLNKLYVKNAAGPQSNSGVAELLAKEVASLIISWMESNQSGTIRDIVDTPNPVDDGMPVMDVDSALSQYIINTTLNNNIDLKNELQRVQERLRRVF
ncbi:hypothetical protein H4R24_002653 [Coemansia sp. RSA 988]|nr:hypothetical protein H4R24_002653 [Coemansia sp. RSA 988]